MSSRLPARRRWQLFIAQDAGPTFRVKTPGISRGGCANAAMTRCARPPDAAAAGRNMQG